MKTSFDGYASFIILDLISNCPYFLFVFIEKKAFHKLLQQKRAEVRKSKNLLLYTYLWLTLLCTFMSDLSTQFAHF